MPAGPPPPMPPEYLQQGGGQPIPPSSGGASGRRKAVIASGAIIGLGAATAAVFGAMWYFGTGPQPSEALPDSTIAYVSIDIDPSGEQLLEAKEALEKFPAWNDQEIAGKKDLRKAVFDEVLAEAPCDLAYNDDIEPWLGDRAAAAAVDLGEDEPVPVFVVQVKDADKAEDAFAKFNDCEPGEGESAGWAISGEWAVLAETEEIATQVAEDAQDNPLSEDDDFEKWTDEAGDPGILTAYAAPEAGKWLAENAGGFMGMGFGVDGCAFAPAPDVLGEDAPEGVDPFEADCDEPSGDVMPDELTEVLEDFSGAALTVRFDDGGLEIETATSVEDFGFEALTSSDNAGESIETLPDDTAAAIAYGFEEGWFEDFLDYAESFSGMDVDVDELLAQVEDELGVDLPEDAETLTGESAVIALGSDFDPEVFFGSDVDVTELPIGVKIKGDPDAIQDVIDKILDGQDVPEEDKELFVSDSDGDFIAIGPNEDYRDQILDDGDLGGSDTYQDVVRESGNAASVFYVNFDAGDGWLEALFEGDDEVQDNVAPLEAAGLSAWADDGIGHAVLRITTED
ncbi:MAG TPA: DUF3352 domain-containing protein [Nocardioides sp.]|nr:DUF3352 domain-containing protein [Nocardioides sp.]